MEILGKQQQHYNIFCYLRNDIWQWRRTDKREQRRHKSELVWMSICIELVQMYNQDHGMTWDLGTIRSSFTWELCVRPTFGNYAFGLYLGTMRSSFTWDLCIRFWLVNYVFALDMTTMSSSYDLAICTRGIKTQGLTYHNTKLVFAF